MILPADDAAFAGVLRKKDPPPPPPPAFSVRVAHALSRLVVLLVAGGGQPPPPPIQLDALFDVLQGQLVYSHAQAAAALAVQQGLRGVYVQRLSLAEQAIRHAICTQRVLRWAAAHPLRLIGEPPMPSPTLVARAARHLFLGANLRPLDDELGASLPSGAAHVVLGGEAREAAVSSPAAVLRALLPALEALALASSEWGPPVAAAAEEGLLLRLRHVMYALSGVLAAAEDAAEVQVVWAEWGQSRLEALLLDNVDGSLLHKCGWLEYFAMLDASAYEGV